jgi:PAS domain S-box-containing protein
MHDVMSERRVFLSTVPAERAERRLALTVVLLSLAAFIAAAPFAARPMPPVWAFIPFYESALAFSDLITAVLLFAQFSILRSRALLVLACGYLFTAVMVVPHALTFPGLFSPTGLLGAGPQTTAWLYMFWHGGFPLVAICYALLKHRDGKAWRSRRSSRAAILSGVAAVLGVAVAVTLLATAGYAVLPVIMRDNGYTAAMMYVNASVWTLSLVALVVLWVRRPHSVLDLWLMVVMCAWLLDVALSAVLNAGRFDLGFYVGRIYGLLAATFVLLMLLLGTSALYARLVRLLQAEHRRRERTTEALHDSLAREHAVFSSAFVGILTVDENGTIESLNPAAERLFGRASESAAGSDVGHLIDLDGSPDIGSAMRLGHLLGAGGGIHEFEALRADGSTFPIDLMLAEMPIGGGRRFVVFVRDITQRRRAERMKDEFVATASHELRTPLTSIAGSLGLLIGGGLGRLPAPATRLIKIAHTNSQRLVRLVDDILDIEKIESGNMAFKFQRIEVGPLVEQAVAANRAFADGFKVRVRLDACAGDAVVCGDADRLTQVIVNLLSNAVKFSPPGQEVAVSVEVREDYVRIAVADRGPGIPDDFKARIFEKLVQVDATDSRQRGGTGLGLSIVKQIVTRHGGEVGYDAAPGGGTIFQVDLPSWDAKTVMDAGPQPGGTPILVCEDDPDSAAVLCVHLEQAGFEPEVAGTAEEAVRAASQKTYEAILVDLLLPDGDGISLIERFRSQWRYRNTPIIVVSANPELGHAAERWPTLHVLDWIRKPVDFDHLIRVLH